VSRAAALVLGLLLLAPTLALAQACPGSISATTLRPVPPGAAIAVPGRIDSPQEHQMQEAAIAALRRAGRGVAQDAALVLSWRGGFIADGPGRDGLTLEDVHGIPTVRDSDELSWVQLAPRLATRPSAPPAPPRLMATLEVRDRATGRVTWTAMLSCTRHEPDDRRFFSALADAVVPLIGQTVAGRPF
jgi:hypothetical protein